MAQERTPAVQMTESEDLQNGIQRLAQHNAAHYSEEQYAFEGSGYAPSGSNSAYSTPEPGHLMVDRYGRGYNGPYINSYEDGAGPHMDGYGTPLYYPSLSDGYFASPAAQPTPYAGYTVSSPQTPGASDQSSNGKRKRGPRTLASTRSASRTAHSPKPKRSKQAKGEKTKVPKIDAPLSILTKDYDNIPVKDMDAWVNRSAEIRQVEVEKRKGKITRPMNSFMLYRSAYADRTKVWCLQNNHQVVSSVSGESWPMEPKEIRDLYTEYARIERDNHQKAHPGYKFSPSKAGAASRKRRETSEEDEEELSDLDNLDSEWRPARAKSLRSSGVKRTTPDTTWQTGNAMYSSPERTMTSNPIQQQSTYHYNNPGKPLPIPMLNDDLYGQYYQTSVRANIGHPYTEDVFVRRANHAGVSYGTATPLIGLPGGNHSELLDEHPTSSTPVQPAEPQVDPFLLAQDGNDFGGLPTPSKNEHDFGVFDHPDLFAIGAEPSEYQDDPTLTHGLDTWHYGGNTSPSAVVTDFDRWLGHTSDEVT